jgi:hypothetical protein
VSQPSAGSCFTVTIPQPVLAPDKAPFWGRRSNSRAPKERGWSRAIKLGIFVTAKEAKIAKFLYPDPSFNWSRSIDSERSSEIFWSTLFFRSFRFFRG